MCSCYVVDLRALATNVPFAVLVFVTTFFFCSCCGECVPDWICQCDGSKYKCVQNVPFGLPCVCPADEPDNEPDDEPDDEPADDPADEPVYILPFFPDPADFPDMHGEACEVEGSEETEGEDCR